MDSTMHDLHDHMMMNMSSMAAMDMDSSSPTMNPHAMHNMPSMDMSDSGGMMMVLHAGYTETIVFPGWKTENVGMFIASCVALFLIAILYEAIKCFRERINCSKLVANRRQMHIQVQDTNDKKLQIQERLPIMTYKQKLQSFEHIIQTSLHAFQFAISYFLMLAAMTYNSWICLSILLGICVGFYFFGANRNKIDLNEDCH